MSEPKKAWPIAAIVWSFIVGAAAMLVLTLSTGWLTTQGVVHQKAEAARTAALVPFCVAKAQQDPLWKSNDDKHSSAAFLKKTWDRDTFVEDAGWATLPGSDSADANVAEGCATALEKVANPGA
ncbi:MAG TPA: hypothetical protein VHA35_23105 [Dongiaceae bacterium]|jgi:hypothetical protein|nr:hypothetical protein [Dongiaceae bacterium]